MCGIVGFTGNSEATPILVDGLKRLEYRGYDSAGIALFSHGGIEIVKCKGYVAENKKGPSLESRLIGTDFSDSSCGIGHTRWATHGAPSDENSHPHLSMNGKFALVHNGIIENYAELKAMLIGKGYTFKSQTDTEVAVNLIENIYDGNLLSTVQKAQKLLRGSYAFGIICMDNPGEIIAVRKESPLIIGLAEDGNFIASDLPAIIKHTRKYYILEDYETAVLTRDSVKVFNGDGEEIEKKLYEAQWNIEAAEKGGYEHFMLKEIFEQPSAVKNTISPRLIEGIPKFDELNFSDEQMKNIGRIYMIACGSACHVCLVGKSIIESMARIPCEVQVASEFRYNNPIMDKNDLAIIVSQSGETADTLTAMRMAKAAGVHTAAIVNTVGSSIAREADSLLYTWAGPEIAVATTKAYSAQLTVIYMIAIKLSLSRGLINEATAREMSAKLLALPAQIEKLIKDTSEIQDIAKLFYDREHVFFLGRGIDYSAAMEASLKLKEISYIHSEAYAAGELKHGTISLITEGTLVVALATQKNLYDKISSNITEVKARGAIVMVVCNEDFVCEDAKYLIRLPSTNCGFTPSLSVVPLQLFAYYISVLRGCSVDKPRNLAKSVTVE